MRRIQWIFICLLFVLVANAQPIQRDLLSKFNLQQISNSIIPKEKWKPYPTTPAEWNAALPDSMIQKLIKNGEEALPKPFLSISASVAMAFAQIGRAHV